MYLNQNVIDTLASLQDIDLELLRAKKELKELPERDRVFLLRKKKETVAGKRAQVEMLHAKAEERLARIVDEDDSLAKKQRQVQAELDEVRGDYRSVEARAKKLNGIAKRRATLEGELNGISAELAKIEAVQKQVMAALSTLDAQMNSAEKTLIDKGGALERRIGDLQNERMGAAAQLPEDVREIYQRIAAGRGGVAFARLQRDACGVCRANIERGRLIDMRAHGNVGTCPYCGRLILLTPGD